MNVLLLRMNPSSLPPRISRRRFCGTAAVLGVLPFLPERAQAAEVAAVLPSGSAPAALDFPWFPSRLHAFVWRNWLLASPERMAAVVGARARDIRRLGRSLGLKPVKPFTVEERKRANLTLIRANWHLLPYPQLLALLGWDAEELAYTLREDDFFFHKLGLLKPQVETLRWAEPSEAQNRRAGEIARTVQVAFGKEPLEGRDRLFAFVDRLSRPPKPEASTPAASGPSAALRLGYSYFALYGDPLLDPALDPYPDGYLARLAQTGVNAVWLQGVLARLTPLPWTREKDIERRRTALRALVTRAARHGVKVYLYLNEPRTLRADSAVFTAHPDWKGTPDGEFRCVCTSVPEVRAGLREGVADLVRAVPGLGGFLTITASENPTNCWSHGRGGECPRCRARRPAEVIAEVNAAFLGGIRAAGGSQRLLAWDWGWADAWAEEVIRLLPEGATLMSVSEWGLPIERGGVKTTVGEYCLSAIGPGPRAKRHWAAAKARGLEVAAKVQFGVTWEIAAVPYLPVLENVARHAAALKEAGVGNLMLGWTLGGHPSPNLQAVAEIAAGGSLESLALRRHGPDHAGAAVEFWKACSAAYREFPFHGGTVYSAPLQMGPANPLWSKPTGFHAAMVGIPYDDLDAWRSVYPAEVFLGQLETVAAGFEAALTALRSAVPRWPAALAEEAGCIEAAAIHYASVANQARFVMARKVGDRESVRRIARAESVLAVRMHALQSRDARFGFEASNQYFYTPLDLVEKVVNAEWVERGER